MTRSTHLPLTIAFFFSLIACSPKKKGKDIETNTYYANYVKIYKNYKTVNADTTLEELKRYLNVFPEEAKAWSFLGTVYLDQKKYSEAIAAFEKAINLDSNLAHPHAALGYLYYKNEKLSDAEKQYNKAVQLGDTSLQTAMNRLVLHSFTLTADSCLYEANLLAAQPLHPQHLLFALGSVYFRLHAFHKSDSIFNRCEATKTMNKKDLNALLEDKAKTVLFMERISK